MNKTNYIELCKDIFKNNGLQGGLLESAYIKGIKTDDFTCCYIDGRIKNHNKIRKELAMLFDCYFRDFPNAIKPLYSYK